MSFLDLIKHSVVKMKKCIAQLWEKRCCFWAQILTLDLMLYYIMRWHWNIFNCPNIFGLLYCICFSSVREDVILTL